MSGLNKLMSISVRNLCYSINNLSLQCAQTSSLIRIGPRCLQTFVSPLIATLTNRSFSTTQRNNDLMQFFDDPKNWCENEVKVGRAWNLDELRIKSNKDLHQLWFILLKERNMLLTMENECNDQVELFPSPERLDKVKISMENLETVVRERNKAYHLLETGTTGERPERYMPNKLGIRYNYRYSEHVLPPESNGKSVDQRFQGYGRAVRKFLLLYREKLYNEKRKAKNRARNEVMMILRRNPNMDHGLLRSKFPGVDIDKLVNSDKIRGHYVPKIQT